MTDERLDTILDEMTQICLREGRPVKYCTDLLYDARWLLRQRPDAFVWALREWGTHVVAYRPGDELMAEALEAIERSNPETIYYVCVVGAHSSVRWCRYETHSELLDAAEWARCADPVVL